MHVLGWLRGAGASLSTMWRREANDEACGSTDIYRFSRAIGTTAAAVLPVIHLSRHDGTPRLSFLTWLTHFRYSSQNSKNNNEEPSTNKIQKKKSSQSLTLKINGSELMDISCFPCSLLSVGIDSFTTLGPANMGWVVIRYWDEECFLYSTYISSCTKAKEFITGNLTQIF